MEKLDVFDTITLEKPVEGKKLIAMYPNPYDWCTIKTVKPSEEYENVFLVQSTTNPNPNHWVRVLWIRRK